MILKGENMEKKIKAPDKKSAVTPKKYANFFLMTVGCLMLSAGVYFFEIPNNFITGSVSSLAIILEAVTTIAAGVWILSLNILLLILSFVILGKDTGVKTVYCTLLYSATTFALDFVLPIEAPLSAHPVAELVYAILLTSVGSAIMFNCGGSGGGTDIIALIVKKYTNMNIGVVVLCTDLLAAASSFYFFGPDVGVLSLLGLLARAFVVDTAIESINASKYFVVITTEREKITSYIMQTLERGVTVTDAVGEYTQTLKAMIHAVCNKSEAVKLRTKIKELDPNAFVIISTSNDIIGSGFKKF